MKRTLTAVGASLGMLLTASVANAQNKGEFGTQGQFIISAGRLVPFFGFTHTSADMLGPLPGGETKDFTTSSQTSLSFLWGTTTSAINGGGNTAAALSGTNFYTVPRVGFDYVVVPNVTIGGEIAVYFTLGGSTSRERDFTNGSNNVQSTDAPSTVIFGIAPRGGYILQLTDLFSLWLRGGFSYYTASTKSTINQGNGNTSTNTVSIHQPAIDLDPQFVITPIPHLGFTAGLTADIPIAGGYSSETVNGNTTNSQSASSSIFFLGVTLGMLGYF
jgi:hypothetical protein